MAEASLSLSPNHSPILPPRYPGVARALAHHLARRAVERRLRAQGLRVSHIPYADISAQARDYLAAHPELVDQAAETVRNNPKLRTLAEREERERARM
jgi:hypothetical protein